ncbi:RPM1 interacting protein 13-like [Euphorbia lathyris]|uniref:RPM1 interacting protein 13-like n=1 Tax=Euphorbia lathyris TaxID=212925 RepID=UPI003313B995
MKEEMEKVAAIKKSSKEVICLSSDEESSPLRPIFCLKTKMDTKPFDDAFDCFILDFDPSDPIKRCISNLSLSFDGEISVVSEKGQVACRDYPHARHMCVQFPFEKTPHESFCNLCYCYVCDSAAPCKYWNDPKSAHCDASDHTDSWKSLRNSRVRQPPICS